MLLDPGPIPAMHARCLIDDAISSLPMPRRAKFNDRRSHVLCPSTYLLLNMLCCFLSLSIPSRLRRNAIPSAVIGLVKNATLQSRCARCALEGVSKIMLIMPVGPGIRRARCSESEGHECRWLDLLSMPLSCAGDGHGMSRAVLFYCMGRKSGRKWFRGRARSVVVRNKISTLTRA
jgi:hypothetical protein